MKKLIIILLSLIFSLPAFCATYGQFAGNPYSYLLSTRLIHMENISYCTYTGKEGTDPESLSLFFKAAFNRWTLWVADYIEKSGRAKEFPYAMQILKRPVALQYLGACSKQNAEADIAIISGVERCSYTSKSTNHFIGTSQAIDSSGNKVVPLSTYNAKSAICIVHKFVKKDEIKRLYVTPRTRTDTMELARERYSHGEQFIQNLAEGIVTPEPEYLEFHNIFYAVSHEIGHAFGLSDEYKVSNHTQDGTASPYRGDGLMARPANMTDDDINGMIVLIYSLGNKTISFKPFGNLPGTVLDNKFILPIDESELSDEDLIKLKQSIRITDKEYKTMMDKYLAL